MALKLILAALLSLSVAGGVAAQSYTPTPEIRTAQQQFRDHRFGIFLHWGIYSMTAQGEWYMQNRDIHWREYEKLASGFYPSRFNAKEWVEAIKNAGAKYICITTRHHDGFSMFDTAYSDFNIVDATPYGRDILKELADECHRQGIALHLYYSHIDWRREDYPEGRTGHGTGRTPGHGDWANYYQFMNNQLTELLTRYGEIGAIWFDGLWDKDGQPDFDWQLPEQYALIHRLQPSCLVANNHHLSPFAGEDIQIFERDLPGENHSGLSGQDVSQLPLETCETMNRSWGYRIEDTFYKSTERLIRLLVSAAGKDANLLLNMGPQPNGELPEEGLKRLKEMGEWLKTYGETIYGTRQGDVKPRPWGVTTRRGEKMYVHILDLEDRGLYLPMTAKVKSAVKFDDRTPVKFTQTKEGVLLQFEEVPTGVDYVVELTTK